MTIYQEETDVRTRTFRFDFSFNASPAFYVIATYKEGAPNPSEVQVRTRAIDAGGPEVHIPPSFLRALAALCYQLAPPEQTLEEVTP